MAVEAATAGRDAIVAVEAATADDDAIPTFDDSPDKMARPAVRSKETKFWGIRGPTPPEGSCRLSQRMVQGQAMAYFPQRASHILNHCSLDEARRQENAAHRHFFAMRSSRPPAFSKSTKRPPGATSLQNCCLGHMHYHLATISFTPLMIHS